MDDLQSLDYEEAEFNWIKSRLALPPAAQAKLVPRLVVLTSTMMLLVGICVGSISYFITFLVEILTTWKWELVGREWDAGNLGRAYLYLMATVTGLALAAMVLTIWAPTARGSGIPHVKGYLNGIKLPDVLSVPTLIAKVLGIACGVAAGLPVGREGPMVHAGAITAAQFSTILSHGLPGRIGKDYGGFDNDYHRRNYVSMGAAAGVAAAFHAPIGGILFALEEVSSFWDPTLTLYSFVCACIAAFMVSTWSDLRSELGIGYIDGYGSGSGSGGTGSSGSSSSSSSGGGAEGHVAHSHEMILWRTHEALLFNTPYRPWELLICILLGAICGLSGAAFNWLNMQLTILRKRIYKRRWADTVASLSRSSDPSSHLRLLPPTPLPPPSCPSSVPPLLPPSYCSRSLSLPNLPPSHRPRAAAGLFFAMSTPW